MLRGSSQSSRAASSLSIYALIPQLYFNSKAALTTCVDLKEICLIMSSTDSQDTVVGSSAHLCLSNHKKKDHGDLRQALENLGSQVSFTSKIPRRRLASWFFSFSFLFIFNKSTNAATRTLTSTSQSPCPQLRSEIPDAVLLRSPLSV